MQQVRLPRVDPWSSNSGLCVGDKFGLSWYALPNWATTMQP